MAGVVLHTAATITDLLRSFFVTEATASRDGFLQNRQPWAVLVGVCGLLGGVVVARNPVVVATLATTPVALAVASSVSIRQLLARSTLVPLASGLVVVPQAVLLPGPSLVEIAGLSVTVDGVAYVCTFTLRVWTGVALLAVVVLTTPFSDLVAALRRLRVPTTAVWLLVVTYRYLFLFFSELRRLLVARNGRTVGHRRWRDAWRDVGRLSGTFLLRVIERGERVHRGMRARGGGRAPSPYPRGGTAGFADYAFVAAGLAVALAVGVGRWLL